jgi:hypothetical protein
MVTTETRSGRLARSFLVARDRNPSQNSCDSVGLRRGARDPHLDPSPFRERKQQVARSHHNETHRVCRSRLLTLKEGGWVGVY